VASPPPYFSSKWRGTAVGRGKYLNCGTVSKGGRTLPFYLLSRWREREG